MSGQPPLNAASLAWRITSTDVLRKVQRDVLEAVLYNRFVFVLGCRQYGKSFLDAWLAVTLAGGYEGDLFGKHVEIPAHDVLIISKNRETSQSVIRACKMHLRAIGVQETPVDDKFGSMNRIVLANGCHIHAFAGTPDSIHGFTGTVIVDEHAANPNDPEELWAQAFMVSSAFEFFRVIVTTNAGAKGCHIDKWLHAPEFEERRDEFVRFNHTIHDVYPNGLPERIKRIKRAVSKMYWDRYMLNKFVDDGDRAISDAEITMCKLVGNTCPDGAVYFGIDPGLTVNPTGFVAARCGEGAIQVLDSEYWYGPKSGASGTEIQRFHEWQMEQVATYVAKYNPARIRIDRGSVGAMLANALHAKYGNIVDRVTSNEPERQVRWVNVKGAIDDCALSVPIDCRDLLEDMTHVQLAAGSEKRKRDELGVIVLPKWPASDGVHVLHADCFDALLLVSDYASHSVGGVASMNFD